MKYYIIAGEASGDLHGSNLMKGLYAQDPEADIRFWGGELMNAVYTSRQSGEGWVKDYRDTAVMGYLEVLLKSVTIARNVRFCKEDIAAWKPDAVILIDYPGFNFKIAEFAHGAGFKVFYYIAPKVWASREGRIRKPKAYVDRLNESIDGLNLKYDEEKDKLNKTTEAIQKKIDKMREEAMAAAYTKNAKAAWEEYANAEMKAAEVKDELALKQKQEKWNSLSESEKQVNGQLQQEIQDLKRSVNDYNGAMDKALVDANKWTNAAQKDAWKGLVSDAKKAGVEIPKSVSSGIKAGKYQIPTSVKELQALIRFDEMKKQATGDAKKTADALSRGLLSGEKTAAQAAKQMEKAMSKELSKGKGSAKEAGKGAGKGYASGARSRSGDAKSAGKALHSGATKGAAGKLDRQGKTAGSSYSSGMKNTKRSAKSAAEALNSAAKNAADKKSLLYSIGSSIGSGLASGMRSALGSVKAAASALIDQANKAAKAKAKVNSPSKLFRDGVGISIPEGLAAGIRKGSSMVAKEAGSMIDTANAAAVLQAPKKDLVQGSIAAAIAQSTENTGSGAVYNIGDVTLSVDKLADAATLEDIVTVFRRAKQFT